MFARRLWPARLALEGGVLRFANKTESGSVFFSFFKKKDAITVSIVTLAIRLSLSVQDIEAINSLLTQLTGRTEHYSHDELMEFFLQDKIISLFAVEDGKIVGMAFLKIDDTRFITQNYTKGFIGDVVVDASYRGAGVGRALVEGLIAKAKQNNLAQVNLTSNPKNPNRAAAIALYEKLGFKKIGEINNSNYYRLVLKNP